LFISGDIYAESSKCGAIWGIFKNNVLEFKKKVQVRLYWHLPVLGLPDGEGMLVKEHVFQGTGKNPRILKQAFFLLPSAPACQIKDPPANR